MYLDNDELYDNLKESVSKNKPTDELVDNLYLLADNIVYMKKFINVNNKEDMIQSAVLKCIKIYKKYDLKQSNPFAYFTTVIRNSFFDTMRKEIKHSSNVIDIDINDSSLI